MRYGKVMTSVSLAMGALAMCGASVRGAVLFQSDFSGTDNASLNSSPDWVDTWDQSDADNTLGMQTVNNQGYLAKTTTSSGSTGAYKGVKAEISGAPAVFNPADQLRFQIDVNQMVDPRSQASQNIYFVQYLSPTNLTSQPYTVTAERLLLFVWYDKGTSPSTSVINFTFNQAVNSSSNGVGLWSGSVSANGLEVDDTATTPNMDIQFAMELRDGNAGNARAGYQVVYDGVGQGWNYSNWFDLEGSAQPFASNWVSNWAGNTQWYLEIGGNGKPAGMTETWIDNAIVTGVPEPAMLGLLAMSGVILIRRRNA